MKNYIAFLLFAVMLCKLDAQKHELGVFLGGTNGITDIGRTDYINPLPRKARGEGVFVPLNLGVLYRYNLNPQQSLRANLHYTSFTGDDRFAKEEYRRQRRLNYSQSIYETSLFYEYNFFSINSEQKSAHSPYIFMGLGAFGYKHPTYTVQEEVDERGVTLIRAMVNQEKLKFSYTIPFGVGYKYKFNYNWVLGLEVGFRPTFEDDIDKGYARKEDFDVEDVDWRVIAGHQVGDQSNLDWYVFSGFTLTYNFGRMPCFCD